MLLRLLVKTFVPAGPMIIGVDETLERRWGKKISAKGIYRDPVRSTHERFVKASGLRWVCLMLVVPVPWARRVWALAFLSILAPSERYAAERGKHHKIRPATRMRATWYKSARLSAFGFCRLTLVERYRQQTRRGKP